MWHWLVGLTSENWQAIGAVGTLAVAVVAAGYARSQVSEARSIRLEQSQPQVIVDIEAHSMLLELVIKNTGPTTARDVKVTFHPGLASTIIEQGRTKMLTSAILTRGIASMPPGKSYRLLFENAPARYKRTDLPRSYEATATYTDTRKRKYRETYILDLDALYGYNTISVYGIHDAAKALREMQSNLEKWREFSGGLKVVVRDGDKRDQEEQTYFRRMVEEERMERRRLERERRMQAGPTSNEIE